MWITAWLLVGSINIQQVTFPPFYSREDCEAVREQWARYVASRATQCIETKVFVNVTR
jgi:hypothetical protein